MRVFFIIFVLFNSVLFGASKSGEKLYQISTIDALLAGYYDGDKTVADLKAHGDFGLGTFNGIDGEMVVYKGVVYHVKSTGEVKKAGDNEGVPFAAVNFFKTDEKEFLSNITSYIKLKKTLDNYKECKNYPCAFKISGEFSYVKTRAAPKAHKPYPPLAEYITKTQKFFEAKNIKGTLIGYKLPKYFAKLNVPGYHLHFISDDKKFGGHVLEVALKSGLVELDILHDVDLRLLQTDEFKKGDIKVGKDDLDKVEKMRKEK